MSKVQPIESVIQKLSSAEKRQMCEWIDEVLEDGLEFTDDLKPNIGQSQREVSAGSPSRARRAAGCA